MSRNRRMPTLGKLYGRKQEATLSHSPAARGGNLAKIPPNQIIDHFGRGSSIESESE